MATITLAANTNLTAIAGLVNGDTIDCNGFLLTINQQPTHTNISVVSPGKAGTVTISGAYDLSTWSFTAGTTTMMNVPANARVGSVKGGNASCVNVNSGRILACYGSDIAAAFGCNNNNALIDFAKGGAFAAAHGVGNQNCTVLLAEGGVGLTTYGVSSNLGNTERANNAHAINLSRGNKTIIGPEFHSQIANTQGTTTVVFCIGPRSPLATFETGITVVEYAPASVIPLLFSTNM